MQVSIQENSIILTPETQHERNALQMIAGKSVTVKYQDDWHQVGPVVIKLARDDWDDRRRESGTGYRR